MEGERDKAKRHWWQFSVRELLLFTLVAALCVGWRIDRRRTDLRLQEQAQSNSRLKQDNSHLKDELGYIDVVNPSKVYFRRLPTRDDMTWRYRVYLPEGKKYKLRITDRKGSRGGGNFHKPPDQFTLIVTLRRDDRGVWHARVTAPRSARSRSINEIIAWRIEELMPLPPPQDDVQEIAADEDVELLRLLDGDFRIWLEPDVPRGKRRLNAG